MTDEEEEYDASLDDGGIDDDEEAGVIVPLSDNLIAWISEVDRELLQFDWRAKHSGTKELPQYYAVRDEGGGKLRISMWLHREVWERMIGEPVPQGFMVDHINRDKLDCRRSNLRLARPVDNERNKGKRRSSFGRAPTSKYKGVTRTKGKKSKPWRAIYTLNKKQIALGYFEDEKEAAKAYNKTALYYGEEFAVINEFEEDEA